MVQTVYDYLDYSIDLPSPQFDTETSPYPKNNKKKAKKIKKSKQFQATKSEENDDSSEMKYKCTICGRCFKKGWNLKEHIQRHSNTRPYRCSLCGKG